MEQSCAGAILPLVEHNWLKWSHDKYNLQRRDNGLGFRLSVWL